MTKINGFFYLVSKRKYFLKKTKIRVKLYGLNLRMIPKHGEDCQNGTLNKTFSKIYSPVFYRDRRYYLEQAENFPCKRNSYMKITKTQLLSHNIFFISLFCIAAQHILFFSYHISKLASSSGLSTYCFKFW